MLDKVIIFSDKIKEFTSYILELKHCVITL